MELAELVTLYEKGHVGDPANYRPISLLIWRGGFAERKRPDELRKPQNEKILRISAGAENVVILHTGSHVHFLPIFHAPRYALQKHGLTRNKPHNALTPNSSKPLRMVARGFQNTFIREFPSGGGRSRPNSVEACHLIAETGGPNL